MADQTCKECGCHCRSCDQGTLHLHVEIENLKQRLVERDRHIVTMETNFLSEADKFPDGEYAALTEELLTWQEKYSRLYESYKRVQKVNQGLEDKLLRVVDKCESEKGALTRDVASLTQRLVDARFNVTRLQEENDRYRNDLNLAIQFLQCKPANFVPQKFEQLPSELQQKVRMYMTSKRRSSDSNGLPPKVERRTIKVPIPTFPPTAMVYSVNKTPAEKDLSDEEKEIGDGKPPVDIVSAAILAKILEERERERLNTKHCETCSCPTLTIQVDVGTQTQMGSMLAAPNFSLCGRCGETPGLSPTRMSLRYSSSLLGSGEASQVLVSLSDETDPSLIPAPVSLSSSQPCSVRHSPQGLLASSTVNSASTSLLNREQNDQSKNDELDDHVRLNLETNSNSMKSSDSAGWDDWSQNVGCNKKNSDMRKVDTIITSQSQANETLPGLIKNEVDMPKVSTSSSPSFFRVNMSVMPSPVSQDLSSNRRITRTSSSKGKGTQSDAAVETQETLYKDPDSVLINVEGPRAPKDSLNLDFASQGVVNSNFGLKINQTRLLPETKLFASGDTLEVLPTDLITYPSEQDASKRESSERRLSNTSLKGSPLAPNPQSNWSLRNSDGKDKEARPSGPRPCSLRFQAGSNNILLDNAHSYAPVLYTSRHHGNSSGTHTHALARGNDPLVHGARSRSASASSMDDLWGHMASNDTTNSTSNQRLQPRVNMTRTETGV